MYKVNDAVIYASYGVCIVKSVEKRDFTGKDVEYYILQPVSDQKSTFYVPTDREDKLKKVLSPQEVSELISDMPQEECQWISDDYQRKDTFRKIIEGGDRHQLISMIKAIYLHRQQIASTTRKLHSADERFLSDAEDMLYDEFAYVLEIPREKVPDYIREHVIL